MIQKRSKWPLRQLVQGFTLLEILLALFIFSLISLMLSAALRTVLNTQEGIEQKAETLHELQLSFLFLSRDLPYAINRPVLNEHGREDRALFGDATQVSLTHTGWVNPQAELRRSELQRSQYRFREGQLQRVTWPVLDRASKTKSSQRVLLSAVQQVRFEYLDKNNRFSDHWPLEQQKDQVLPKAIRVSVDLKNRGKVSQLYVIAAENVQENKAPKKPQKP